MGGQSETATTHVGLSSSAGPDDAPGAPGAPATRDPAADRAAAGQLLEPGTRIGRYVIDAHVGAGAMGRIYSAHDPELDRKVAVKLLRAERDDDAGRDRLLREARALARVAHPNVVAVYDAGTVGDRVFVAMELVSGTTLAQVLARRRHGWREALELVVPVAAGLAAVHAAGLVHRDVKPDNIMLGDDGRIRLMDFGLACAQAGDPVAGGTGGSDGTGGTDAPADQPSLTRTGTRIGTPPYMAPEQWRGEAADARTDQFALCVTLWEALHRQRPFRGGTLPELERAITTGAIAPPPRTGDVPRWLQRALTRGLAADPGQRHASVAALIDVLARGRRRVRRRSMAAAAALAVVGLVAVVTGLGASNARSGPRRPTPPALPAGIERCADGEVCARGPFPIPVCMRRDGEAAGESRPCQLGTGAPCPAREVCVTSGGTRGEVGRCLPVCTIQDDRPACTPGCYNQQCAGKFDLCARASGTCRPVPCTGDEQCAAMTACDFPERGGAGFRCNLEVGMCERSGGRSPPAAPAAPAPDL